MTDEWTWSGVVLAALCVMALALEAVGCGGAESVPDGPVPSTPGVVGRPAPSEPAGPGPGARSEAAPGERARRRVFDVEQAAALEVDILHGGPGTRLLSHLATETERQGWAAGERMIFRRLGEHRAAPPHDPLLAEHWGHDARLKGLLVSEHGRAALIKPTFDPDVLAYTTGVQSYSSGTGDDVIRIVATTMDPRATARVELVNSGAVANVNVTAEDGRTVRTYTLGVRV